MVSSVQLKMNNVEDIVNFNKLMSKFSGEAKLVKGKYECDAKSLMGLLAIDTSSPTKLEFDIIDREEILNLLNNYIVK